MSSSDEDIRSVSARDISDTNEVIETSDTVSTELDHQIELKIKTIINAFRLRAQKVKMKIEEPPTPTESFHMSTETSVRQQLILGKALKYFKHCKSSKTHPCISLLFTYYFQRHCAPSLDGALLYLLSPTDL